MDSQLDPIVIKRLAAVAANNIVFAKRGWTATMETVLADLRKDYAIVPLAEANAPTKVAELEAEIKHLNSQLDSLEAMLEDAQGDAIAGMEATHRADAAEDDRDVALKEVERLRQKGELAERVVSDLELYVAQAAVRSGQDPYSRGSAVKHFTFLAELAAEGRAKLREAEEAATKAGALKHAAAVGM